MNDNLTVGEISSESSRKAFKSIAFFLSVLVYLGMLLYTFTHNWSLMTSGVSQDMIIWAALGVISLEFTALALPIALHYWFHSPLQRNIGFMFYLFDLAILVMNVILDFAINSGGWSTTPSWLQMYLYYGVPVTPIIAGVGWSIIWLVDPAQREIAMRETVKAATREAMLQRTLQATRIREIDNLITEHAEGSADDIVRSTIGAARNGRASTRSFSSPRARNEER